MSVEDEVDFIQLGGKTGSLWVAPFPDWSSGLYKQRIKPYLVASVFVTLCADCGYNVTSCFRRSLP